MKKVAYVIKYNENTSLYLQSYDSDGNCIWGSQDTAIEFSSLADANVVIGMIGSGPIGVPKNQS